MSIGSGLAAQFGRAPEVTHGTFVAPTGFTEINKVDIKLRKGVAQGGGLAAGRAAQLGTRRVVAYRDAAGSIDFGELPNKGFGLYLSHMFGTSIITQQAATAAWLQTHTVGDNFGKMMSLQAGVPDAAGTVRPYSYTGTKFNSMSFACSQGSNNGFLTVTADVDCRLCDEVPSLAGASNAVGVRGFHFAQMGVRLGTFGAETAVPGVKGISVKVERPMDTERFYANTAGLKDQQIWNNWFNVTGQIDADFVDKTAFADRFASDGSTSLMIDWVGPLIASTYYETFSLQVPMTFFDGDTPIIDGPGVVSGPFALKGQFDLTNGLVTCKYMSTDTTIV